MDNAEQFLMKCKEEVLKHNFIEATNKFRMALNAHGDPACFFFGDIVRILVNNKKVTFEMDQLYTDIGITDEAKTQLQNLSDNTIISALKIYSNKNAIKT